MNGSTGERPPAGPTRPQKARGRVSGPAAEPEARSAAGGLENNTDNFSAVAWADARWQLLDWLRESSSIRRQRICTTRGVLPVATVRRTATGVSVGGVMVCGSRNCPMCGPRVYGQNRSDIQQCVRAWTEGYGGTVLFGTFTAGHVLGDTLGSSMALVSDAWHGVTSGRGWVRDRREHGVTHWVRVFEEKWSDATGWHAHLHYLAFVEPGQGEYASALLQSMFGRWRRVVEGAGRKVSFLAQDLHEVGGADADKVLGDYFTKQAEDRSSLAPEALSLELAGRGTKFGSTSVTPAELLLLAMVDGSEKWRSLWREYEQATIKRRVIAWSRGLRQFAGVGDELPDDVVSAEAVEREGSLELYLRGKHVRKAMSKAMRAEFVRVVFDQGGAAAVAWLEDRGMTGWLPDEGPQSLLDGAVSYGRQAWPSFEGVTPF